MDSISRQYVRETLKLSYENLKPSTVLRAKYCIKHQLACACAGRDENWNVVARGYVADNGSGSSRVWFSGISGSAYDATLANAAAGMSIIQEDIHREDGIHPALVIVPCALAIGEKYRLSGKKVIEGMVRGYQFLLKTGKSVLTDEFNDRGYRPTATMAPYGNAITAGTMMGLSEDQLVNACGIAGNFSCGINEWARSGADEVYFHNGVSAANGVLAAEFAKLGATGSETIFEGGQGSCNAYSLSPDILRENVENDEIPEIEKVVFKGAPCCNFNQATATIALKAACDKVKPDMVESGVIYTNTRAYVYSGIDCKGPYYSSTQAKMSMQYTFAAMLEYGKPVNEAFKDLNNPAITGLASKLDVVPDTEYDKVYPARMQGRAVLNMKDGSVKTYSTEEARYYDYEDITEGFLYYFSQAFGEERAKQINETIDRLDELEDISSLTELLVL